jgi:ABC-2 type transport system ATP-binding protein
MATHDLFRAKECATRVGIMRHGRLMRTLHADDLALVDLERVYLELMHD